MPNVFFEVVQTKARGKDQEDWYFCINNEQYAWGMPEELGDYPKTSHTVQDILRWMNDAQTKIVWPATHTDIYKYILAPEGIGEDEQQEIMKLALSEGILIEQTEDEMSPRQRVPRLKFNEDKALPF